DLAVGPRGDVVVTSNVLPVVWRIDNASFQVTRHELVLDQNSGRDIGFAGLAYSPQQGAFVAVSGLDGSFWRIDPLLRRAQQVPLSSPIARACGLSLKAGVSGRPRPGSFCVRAEQRDWTVHLAPDYRSGYVRPESCSVERLSPVARLGAP